MKKMLILSIIVLFVVGCTNNPKDKYPSEGDLFPLKKGYYWHYMSYNESSGLTRYHATEIYDTLTIQDTIHLYKSRLGDANSDFTSITWTGTQHVAKGDSFLYYYNISDSARKWKDMPLFIEIDNIWISDWDLQEFIVEDKESIEVPAGVFFAYKIRVYIYYLNHNLYYYRWIAEDVGIVKEEYSTWTSVLLDYKSN